MNTVPPPPGFVTPPPGKVAPIHVTTTDPELRARAAAQIAEDARRLAARTVRRLRRLVAESEPGGDDKALVAALAAIVEPFPFGDSRLRAEALIAEILPAYLRTARGDLTT
jgi:hypothetical protein